MYPADQDPRHRHEPMAGEVDDRPRMCERCEGRGTMPKPMRQPIFDRGRTFYPCPDCNGTGEIER